VIGVTRGAFRPLEATGAGTIALAVHKDIARQCRMNDEASTDASDPAGCEPLRSVRARQSS
jgi:hypothetical protein